MKKISLFLVAFLCIGLASVNAQSYETAIGAKFYTTYGSVGGINIRHMSSANTALEGSLLFYSGGMGIEGLYEYQGPIIDVDGLNYFVGGGGLLGFGTGKNDGTTFALRLTGGVDYKFPETPISVSLGLDPFFQLSPSTGSHLSIGIGLRYILK